MSWIQFQIKTSKDTQRSSSHREHQQQTHDIAFDRKKFVSVQTRFFHTNFLISLVVSVWPELGYLFNQINTRL